MDRFFNPRSVAIAGASQKANLGNFVVQNLKSGFDGEIYPINPNYDTIEGLPCFASIEAVPGPVDLAIVLVPARFVADVLRSCAAKGVCRVIVESAGFDESGQDGRSLQQECNSIAARAGIRLWGPNCMGLVDVQKNYFFTFMHPRIRAEGLLPGHISLIVQSGMMSAIFLVELARRGIGVAKACSIGNRADVNECDLLEFLEKDPDTHVIALYLESIPEGRRFARLTEQSKKPIVLLKGGQSKAGAVAAMSHTSSLSGDSRLSSSILSNQGVVMADSVFQMMDMANTLVHIPQMNPACRIVVITLSGGAGILACDALERNGLPIASFSEATRQKLEKIFPSWMPPSNPIDLFPAVALRGRMAAFMGALNAVMEDDSVDVIVMHVVTGLEDAAMPMAELKAAAEQKKKTIVFWLMGTKDGKEKFAHSAREAGFVTYSDVTDIACCLGGVAHFNAHKIGTVPLVKPEPSADQAGAMSGRVHLTPGILNEFDSKQILRQWQIPVVEEQIADTRQDAERFACQKGFPVVLKGLAPGMAHKTEHGLVRLGISSLDMLETEFDRLQKTMGPAGRVLIQKQLPSDYELIAGFLRDPQFGPCVMFGIGGILAELEPDVAFAMAPLSMDAAVSLIRSLRNSRLLNGFRKMIPLDETAAARILIRLGDLGMACPDIQQMDINPLVVCHGSLTAVDAGIVVSKKRRD